MPEFKCNAPISINISNPSGSVQVVTEDRETANVEVKPVSNSKQDRTAAEEIRIDFEGDELTIEAPESSGWFRGNGRLKIEVRAPSGSNARIIVASASVKCRGRYGDVSVSSASGDVEVDDATGDAKIQTASGGVKINDVGRKLDAKTASGDIAARAVGGSSNLKSASGDIEIADANSDVHSKSASGDLRIGAAHRGVISASTASGEVSVGVAPSTGVWLDLNSVSGKITNNLDTTGDQPESQDLSIQIRTVSGDIDILRAREAVKP